MARPTGNPPGRPRKPTQLAILHGDGKKNPSRVNRAAPHPPGEMVRPDLSEPARHVWDLVAGPLERAGVLTPVDVPLFAELCEALIVARLARVNATREAAGKLVTQPGAASPTTVWHKSMAIVNMLASQFGMTPAARARLVVGEGTGGASSDDLLSG